MIKNEKLKFLNILLWLGSAAAMIGIFNLWSRYLKENDIGLLIEFVVVAAVSLVFLYLISGKKTFSLMGRKLVTTIRILLPTLIFPAFFMVAGALSSLMDRPAPNPDWLRDLLIFAASMFLVGIYEETVFRACAADAMLPLFRKFRHPFFLTALISSLLFGYMHVMDVDWSNFQQVLQFFLKIAATGVSGATYMLAYYVTRDLLGVGIIHFLNDFLPSFFEYLFIWKDLPDGSTYTTGNIETTFLYIMQTAIEIYILIHIYKKTWPGFDHKKALEEW